VAVVAIALSCGCVLGARIDLIVRRGVFICSLAALSTLMCGTSFAHVQHSQPTDPNANSPAGVIYEIPLETARQDAEPHPASSTGTSGTLEPSSGGSSILVPGGQPGSLIHSGNGFGASSRVPGIGSAPSTGLANVQDDTGSAPTVSILVAAVLLIAGCAIGVRARR
jgi:hypothetical protein